MADKRVESQVGVPALMPTLVLDGAPLPMDASIRNFQQGKASYGRCGGAGPMVDLRLLRKHKVFLSLKRDLAMVNLLSTLFFPYHSNNLLLFSSSSFFLSFFFFFWYFGRLLLIYFLSLFFFFFVEKSRHGRPQS